MCDTGLQEVLAPDALVLLVRGTPAGVSTTDYCTVPAHLLTSYLISTVFQLKKFTLQKSAIPIGTSSSSTLRPIQLIEGNTVIRLGVVPPTQSATPVPFTDTEEMVRLVRSCCWTKSTVFTDEVGVVMVSGTPFELPTDKAKAKRMQETWAGARSRQLKLMSDSIAGMPTTTAEATATTTATKPSPMAVSTPVAASAPSSSQRPTPAAQTPASVTAQKLPNTGGVAREVPVVPAPAPAVVNEAPDTYECPSCKHFISVHSRTIHTLRCKGPSSVTVAARTPVPVVEEDPSSPTPSTGSSDFDANNEDDYDCHFEDVNDGDDEVHAPPPLHHARLPEVKRPDPDATKKVDQSASFVPLPPVRSAPPPSVSSPARPRQMSPPPVRSHQPMTLCEDYDVDYCKDDRAMAAKLQREADMELEEQSRQLAHALAAPSHVAGSRRVGAPPPHQSRPANVAPHVNPYRRPVPTNNSGGTNNREAFQQHPRTPVSSTNQRHSGNSHHAFLDRSAHQSNYHPPTRTQQQPTRPAPRPAQQPEPSRTRSTALSQDERLARQLQLEEDEALAKQFQEDSSPSSSHRGAAKGDAEAARRIAMEERKRQEEADEAYALRLMQEDF